MDRRERKGDLTVAVRAAIKADRADIWTALPGKIESYDAVKQTCSVQPTIRAQILSERGKWSDVKLPLLVDCPVVFSGGGDFTMTFPLVQDDEGLIVFSCRCIDAWYQSGGVQNQSDLRMHDLSDGFFIPRVRSQPNVLANVSTTAAQLRNVDGSHLIELGPDGIRLKGPVAIEGNVTQTGALTATGEITAKQGSGTPVRLSTHLHPVTTAPGTTGAPTGA